ncbi:MAG: dihydroorotate dehydrogenase electron transfer subunit [Armatimonadetes bacterium]|nr:dihydroorotate dehydrogenase electron transfer subunit [Armatimonadota bacterium]
MLESEHLPADHHRLLLAAPEIGSIAEPGQFIHVWCHPPDEIDRPPCAALLRRPYSISRLSPDAGVEILLRVRGVGGRLLAAKSPGESLDIIGPLGRGFHASPGLSTAVIVAGGAGLAPAPFLIERLVAGKHRVILLAGAETDEKIPFRVRRPRAGRATLPDLEALGAEVTFVSQSVEGILITQVVEARLGELSEEGTGMFACGPRAMLARLWEVTGGHIPLQVSLEERMACGVGACRSCVVPARSGEGAAYKTVCRDGPVFDASEIDWERLVP